MNAIKFRYTALLVWMPDAKAGEQGLARSVDAILRDKYGFDTKLLLNANRFGILESLNRFEKVLTSGELEPVLDAGRGGHAVFANVLPEVLQSNDQVIEGDHLHQEMRARVVSDSKRTGLTQVPLYSGNN